MNLNKAKKKHSTHRSLYYPLIWSAELLLGGTLRGFFFGKASSVAMSWVELGVSKGTQCGSSSATTDAGHEATSLCIMLIP